MSILITITLLVSLCVKLKSTCQKRTEKRNTELKDKYQHNITINKDTPKKTYQKQKLIH